MGDGMLRSKSPQHPQGFTMQDVVKGPVSAKDIEARAAANSEIERTAVWPQRPPDSRGRIRIALSAYTFRNTSSGRSMP